MIEQM